MALSNLLAAALAAIVPFCAGKSAQAAPLPLGAHERTIGLSNESLTVFTYRPNCREPSLLVVLHGLGRTAHRYRDYARPLADRHCLLVIAPLFDRDRFPQWRYQHGGIVRRGILQNPRRFTGNVIVELVDRIGRLEGRNMPYSLIGHSAGAQFLSRVSAFVTTDAQRIVLANPGTLVFPDLGTDAPYGLGGVHAPATAQAALRHYLAQPVTIYLGQDDTSDRDLNESAAALAQGATRYQRGRNAFAAAQSAARSNSWPLNWRLIEAPKVAHSARNMFASGEASEALRP